MTRTKIILLPLILVGVFAISAIKSQDSVPKVENRSFWVAENAPPSTLLGQIKSSDGQAPLFVQPHPPTSDHEVRSLFHINYTEGDLFANGPFDRERRDRYTFVAVTSDAVEILCTVHVTDFNDNAPNFVLNANETSIVLEFPEHYKGERALRKLLPLAKDADTPEFGLKEFRLVSNNARHGLFQLVEYGAAVSNSAQQRFRDPDSSHSSAFLGSQQANQANSAANQKILEQYERETSVLLPSQNQPADNLLLASGNSHQSSQANNRNAQEFQIEMVCMEELDREQRSTYELTVEAIDGGNPPLLGRLQVIINVLDINDNDPIFSQPLYEAHFKEDTAKGTILQKVQATDADIQANAQITYSIKSHTASSSFSSSQLNSSSSINNNFLELSQQRSQQAGNKKQQQEQALSKQTSSQQNSLGRSTVPQQKLANDMHSSPLTRVGISEHLFEIDPVKGEIYLMNSLDFELDQVHELVIEARDHGSPSRAGTTMVKIVVIDVPDDPLPASSLGSSSQTRGNSASDDGRKSSSSLSNNSESARQVIPNPNSMGTLNDVVQYLMPNVNISSWMGQVSSSSIFFTVLGFIALSACIICFTKIKSLRPNSNYKTERVTSHPSLMASNGPVSKCEQSPNHSTSNEHSNGSISDSHHNHHLHNSSNHRLTGHHTVANSFIADLRVPNINTAQQFINSSNLYHNPCNQLQLQLQPRCRQPRQLPPAPRNGAPNVFTWPQTPGSTINGYSGANVSLTDTERSNNASNDNQSRSLNNWFEAGDLPQAIYTQDWQGSYNWDYLNDWLPDYKPVMPLVQS